MDNKMTEALNRIGDCKDIESVHEVIADILIEDSLEMQRLYEASTCTEYPDGTRIWRLDKDNMMHRVGGPAVEYANGTKVWMVNGRIHRTDGPAIITYDGLSEWYEHGRQLSIEEVVARNLMEKVIK